MRCDNRLLTEEQSLLHKPDIAARHASEGTEMLKDEASSAHAPDLLHDKAAGRFSKRSAPQSAFITYYWRDVVMVLDHIEVSPSLRGTGAGARFAQEVFETVQNEPQEIRLTCPFLRRVASSRPEWRKKFNLGA